MQAQRNTCLVCFPWRIRAAGSTRAATVHTCSAKQPYTALCVRRCSMFSTCPHEPRAPLPPRPLSSWRVSGVPSAAASSTKASAKAAAKVAKSSQSRKAAPKSARRGVGDTLAQRVYTYRYHCTSSYILVHTHLSLHLSQQWHFFVHICERWRPSAYHSVWVLELRRVCLPERRTSLAPWCEQCW